MGLRVHTDGRVTLAIPMRISREVAIGWTLQQKPWLARQFQRLATLPSLPGYRDGETHTYLGLPHRLKIVQGARNGVQQEDGVITIHLRGTVTLEKTERVLMDWYRARAEEILNDLVDQWYPRLEPAATARPTVKMRRMKARWGSCNARTRSILFNTHLIRAPLSCVEYVVVHEICHLKHSGHSRAFYHLLGTLLPDWKERKKGLNQIHSF